MAYMTTAYTEKTTISGQLRNISIAASEMQGWRIHMEDAKIAELNLDHDGFLFGVYDGHGGSEVSTYVSKHLCSLLLQNENYQAGNYDIALQETYLKFDELLQEEDAISELKRIRFSVYGEYPNYECNAGSTALTALIKSNKIYVANSGDSKCILVKGGEAFSMSCEHKPEYEIELNRIKNAGGIVTDGRVNGNLNLSRAIGDFDYKQNRELSPQEQMITAFPDIAIQEITPDCDFLVLGTDGVWELLTNQSCLESIYQGLRDRKPLTTIVEDLLDQCLTPDYYAYSGLGTDNMTCIIVKFHD
ncbi:ARX1_2 [Blepharisma stoltei]|uniref:protein-serine/threonine phosphatase n=1 Tax=Blepharisma stoltei TaxID=1481888 RepID=A0AAU9K153_9CILI|nr:unnamed protein product [Blepharisma stoltei]